jgi:hypothetical protein
MAEQKSQAPRAPYTGPIKLGMVFDFEPGRKNAYERMTVTRMQADGIWCYGRSGETFHIDPEFRKSVVLVSETPLHKPKPVPKPLVKRYDGPIAKGMVFDFEPGKKHHYERLTIMEVKGPHIWARGRSGGTYYLEPEFRDHVVPADG